MRFFSAALLTLAYLVPAVAWAANPYEIFRLGMSEGEAVAAAREYDGDIFNIEEREGGEPQILGGFRILFGDVPMQPYQATGMFVFKQDRLKSVRFDYLVWQDHMPPGICDALFDRVTSDISKVYGRRFDLTDIAGSETQLRGQIARWESTESVISLFMADAPPLSPSRSCDIVSSELFDGNEEERETFEREMIESLARGRQ
ncbi:MAG: hypothetical protein LPK88_01825 [Alphaproteobacteria bacterium]|nr:hypothetical protein [Alphaproteobacteria bacterium]MDX5415046.1 hypothetical protein [Alphaproteobacteria bacterium]MDX5492231.1 hypothetical protein [Alphaproteobacteria bacterium]